MTVFSSTGTGSTIRFPIDTDMIVVDISAEAITENLMECRLRLTQKGFPKVKYVLSTVGTMCCRLLEGRAEELFTSRWVPAQSNFVGWSLEAGGGGRTGVNWIEATQLLSIDRQFAPKTPACDHFFIFDFLPFDRKINSAISITSRRVLIRKGKTVAGCIKEAGPH
jgi:hypothetical protein